MLVIQHHRRNMPQKQSKLQEVYIWLQIPPNQKAVLKCRFSKFKVVFPNYRFCAHFLENLLLPKDFGLRDFPSELRKKVFTVLFARNMAVRGHALLNSLSQFGAKFGNRGYHDQRGEEHACRQMHLYPSQVLSCEAGELMLWRCSSDCIERLA